MEQSSFHPIDSLKEGIRDIFQSQQCYSLLLTVSLKNVKQWTIVFASCCSFAFILHSAPATYLLFWVLVVGGKSCVIRNHPIKAGLELVNTFCAQIQNTENRKQKTENTAYLAIKIDNFIKINSRVNIINILFSLRFESYLTNVIIFSRPIL